MKAETSAVMEVLAGRAPWVEGESVEGVCHLLREHGLAGLVVAEMRGRGVSPILEPLRGDYRYQALRTTLALEAGERARAALEGAGLAVLPFKGMALFGAGVYTDPGARLMEDADLLVESAAAPRAVAVLEEAGFRPWSPWDPSRMGWLSSFTFTDGSAPEGMEPAIDLHWATPYARLRFAAPWPRDPLWDGATSAFPAPEPHFVLIAEHVLKHLRVVPHLRGIADLARLGSHLRDPDLLLRQTERRGSLPGLRVICAFLQDVLRVDLAPEIFAAVAPDAAARRRAQEHLAPDRLLGAPGSEVGGWARVLGTWGLIGSPWGSAREWLRVAVPSSAWLRHRYPAVAPWRRRTRYLGALVSWVRGDGASPLSPNQEWGP